MTATLRRPSCTVRIGATTLAGVLGVSWQYARSLKVATAKIVLKAMPSIATWDAVTLTAGATGSTQQVRFVGLFVEPDYELYPNAVTLVCAGQLIRAQTLLNSNPGGTDLGLAGTGQTDTAMVAQILAACGLGSAVVGGLGTVLGTVAVEPSNSFLWQEGTAAIDMIDQIDQVCQGFRTYDSLGGVVRSVVSVVPSSYAALTFTEGVDLYRGSSQTSPVRLRNRVKVSGYDAGDGNGAVATTLEQASSYLPDGIDFVTEPFSSNLIERQLAADAGGGVSCEDVGRWFLREYNWLAAKISLTTPRDDLLMPGMTVAVQAPGRLGTAANYMVESVSGSLDDKGVWTQELSVIGGLGASSPILLEPVPSFTVLVEKETVVVSGVEVGRWTVFCTDTSFSLGGTLTGRAWASAGSPASGTEPTYTTVFTADPIAQTITLTVTDSNGATAAISQVVGDTGGATTYLRELYLASGEAEDFDGTTYRVKPDIHANPVFACTNGPLWGADTYALLSANQLLTAPGEVTPFTTDQVSCLWVETDVDDQAALAGSNLGRIARSADAGQSWTVTPAAVPDALAVVRCAIDGADPLHYFALTEAHLYHSYDAGTSWLTLQTAALGETFRDLSLSFARSMVSMAGGRLLIELTSGAAQSFDGTPTDIVAVTADILLDRFIALDSDGHLHVHLLAGDTALVAAIDVPGGSVVQQRSLWRDGDVQGMIYAALGTGGAWKLLNAFSAARSWLQLRAPGVGTSPALADYRQIGANGQLTIETPTPGTVLVASQHGLYRRLAPDLWEQTGLGDRQILLLATCRGSPDTLYLVHRVGTGSFVFASSADQGDTASDLTANLPSLTTRFSLVTRPVTGAMVRWISCPDGAPDTVYLSVADATILSDADLTLPPGDRTTFYYNLSGLYRSTDAGLTWTKLSEENKDSRNGTFFQPGDLSNYVTDGPLSYVEPFVSYDYATPHPFDPPTILGTFYFWPNGSLIETPSGAGSIGIASIIGIRGDTTLVYGGKSNLLTGLGYVFKGNDFWTIPTPPTALLGHWLLPVSTAVVYAVIRQRVAGVDSTSVLKGEAFIPPLVLGGPPNVTEITWSTVLNVPELDNIIYQPILAFSPNQPSDLWFCAASPTVHHSTDAGVTWTTDDLGTSGLGNIFAVAVAQ